MLKSLWRTRPFSHNITFIQMLLNRVIYYHAFSFTLCLESYWRWHFLLLCVACSYMISNAVWKTRGKNNKRHADFETKMHFKKVNFNWRCENLFGKTEIRLKNAGNDKNNWILLKIHQRNTFFSSLWCTNRSKQYLNRNTMRYI